MPETQELIFEACDMIEELIFMLRNKNLSDEEVNRIAEIEDFSVNYLGED
jgi:hypothetical protein